MRWPSCGLKPVVSVSSTICLFSILIRVLSAFTLDYTPILVVGSIDA
jgi:hypothetical protein